MRVRNYEVFFGHLLIFSVGTVLLSVVGEKTKTIDWLRGATCPPELDQCWEPARSALRQCYLIHLWVYWRAQRGTKLFRSEGCPKNNWFQLSLGTSQCRYHWLVLHILLGKLLGGMTCILGSGLPLWINHLVQNQAWVFRVLESMLPLWRLGSPCCLVIEGRKHFFGGKAVIGVGTSLAKGQTSLIRQIINKDSKIWYYIIEKNNVDYEMCFWRSHPGNPPIPTMTRWPWSDPWMLLASQAHTWLLDTLRPQAGHALQPVRSWQGQMGWSWLII